MKHPVAILGSVVELDRDARRSEQAAIGPGAPRCRSGAARLLAGVVFAVTLAASSAAQIHLDERESYHNASFLRQNDEIDALLFEAQAARADGRPGEVVRRYRQVLSTAPEALVAFGERTLVRADQLVSVRVGELDPAARRLFVDGVAGAARVALDAALRSGRGGALLEVARTYPRTPQAARAWMTYGELAFEEGRFAAAAWAFEIVTRLEEAGAARQALAEARLQIARAARGRDPGPAEEDSRRRDGGVLVAGTAADAEQWRAVLGEARKRFADSSWSTLLGGNERLGVLDHPEPLTLELVGTGRVPLRGAAEAARARRTADGWGEPTGKVPPGQTMAPVVARLDGAAGLPDRQLGIVATPGALRFIDLATGREAFAPLRFDFDLFVDPRSSRIEPGSVGVSVDGETAYLCLNIVSRRDPKDHALGCVWALDLRREALPLWRFEARLDETGRPSGPGAGGVGGEGGEPAESRPGDPGEAGGHAEDGVGDSADDGAAPVDPRCAVSGPPLIVDGTVFVTASRLRDALSECFLVALDPHDGKARGWTFICSASEVTRFADRFAMLSPGRVDASPMAEADGVIYLLTNLGVVAAVAAGSGEIEWAFRYNRIFAVDSTMYDREALYDTGGWPRTPVLIDGERLYVAPSDSRYLYVLARRPNPKGYIILDDPVERGHKDHFLGTAGDRLLFEVKRSAGRLIAGTDRAGGRLFETPPLEPEERLSGWPVRVGSELWVPTNKNLYRILLDQDGRMADYLTPPESMGALRLSEAAFGCLAASSGYLLSASADWYSVYRIGP